MERRSFLVSLFLIKVIIYCGGFWKGSSNCLDSERKALTTFRKALNDPSNLLSSWDDASDCCEWRGISCHNMTGLGLGAKIAPKSKVAVSIDLVERKLHAKLDGGKKGAAKIQEESNTAEKNEEHSNDEDADPESRTNAFVKKRAMFVATSLQPKKKHK